MNLLLTYFTLGTIGIIAIMLFLQNLALSVNIKFLGITLFPLPLGLAILLAFGVGALVAIPLNWIISRIELRFSAFSSPYIADDSPVIDVEYED